MTAPTYLAKDAPTTGFPPGRTALLVIDPVNDFLSEGGAGYPMTKDVIANHDVVANIRRALDAARRHGIPVLYAPMAYTKEDYEDEALQRRSGINRLMFDRGMFLAGSWGAEIHRALAPEPGDVVLEPHKSLDVFETDLPRRLEGLGITHLVICGMTANLCCESTGRHAMEAGYDVTYLADAIGAANEAFYEAAVNVNYPLIASAVLDVSAFASALEAPAAEGVSVREGDRIVGSDREEIGTVERVVVGEGPDHLVVKRGILRGNPAFVPLDAVTKRSGDEIYLNVPSPLVPAMGWEQPPTAAGEAAKMGPPAAAVPESGP